MSIVSLVIAPHIADNSKEHDRRIENPDTTIINDAGAVKVEKKADVALVRR